MRSFNGTPCSTGIVAGPVVRLDRGVSGPNRIVEDPYRERALFEAAVVLAKEQLDRLMEKSGRDDRDILRVQKALLADNALLNAVTQHIEKGMGSAAAVEQTAEILAGNLSRVEDSYIRQRSSDVLDICRRVVNILDGHPARDLVLDKPSILVSELIYPSDVISLGRDRVLGLATSAGSTQSHAAIIARSMNIPAVVQLGQDFLSVCDGHIAVLDGENGVMILDPDEDTQRQARCRWEREVRQFRAVLRDKTPCITKDGTQVHLLANCSGPQDIRTAIEMGAEGIGLVRSEFLLSDHFPDEEVQYRYYLDCLTAAGDRPVTIRAFDIGADKVIQGVPPRREENPALGLRGYRFLRSQPQVFQTQLCALLRAGVHGNLRVMIPMVSCFMDWVECMEALEQAKSTLQARGVPYAQKLDYGCMIEVPGAVMTADEIAANGADFFSIGTNDLTQYVYAADRLESDLGQSYLPGGLAMMRMVQMTLDSAQRANIPICICGLAAADPQLAEEYVRRGVRYLSMAQQSLPQVKARLCELDLTQKLE